MRFGQRKKYYREQARQRQMQEDRRFDLFLVSLACTAERTDLIQRRIRRALNAGASKEEIARALDLASAAGHPDAARHGRELLQNIAPNSAKRLQEKRNAWRPGHGKDEDQRKAQIQNHQQEG